MYSKEKILEIMKEIKEEASEIKPYLVVAQPRRNLLEKPAQNFDGYVGLHIDMLGFSHGFCNIGGESVDVARNYLIEQALQSGAKYLLFVGEDTVLPYDGFLKLHEVCEKNPDSMCVGVYYIKLSSAMIHERTKDNHVIPANVDPGRVFEAYGSGLDAALIPIKLLQKMKDDNPDIPFCCIGYNLPGIPHIGEDNFFLYRWKKSGYKLLVNTDVQCLHMDLASGKYTAHPSVDLNNYFTQIPISSPLTMKDKQFIDKRYSDRMPKGSWVANEVVKDVMRKSIKLIQKESEVTSLCKNLDLLKPKTILEIGVENGGSLYLWSKFSKEDALIIGIDIDISQVNKDFITNKFTLIEGNSNHTSVLEQVKCVLGNRKVDFLFIDGDHSTEGVKKDFEMYSPLVDDNGIIAFHDIVYPTVFNYWKEIKEKYKTIGEFVEEGGDPMGIGMIMMPSQLKEG